MLIFFPCAACRVNKDIATKEIQFGYGGGVTESMYSYTLKANGQIYKGDDCLGKVGKKKTIDIYREADAINYPTINSPSNTFSYIKIIKSDTSLYYCWSVTAPLQISRLNSKLNNLLPK